jgi:hypothetical protein
MSQKLTHEQVRLLRLRSQLLHRQSTTAPDEPAQVLKELCGVQAQDASAAQLAIRPRSAGLVAADIERARVEDHTIVRTWCMRGTLHLLATEDLGWLLALLGPIFVRSGQRRRKQLGLNEETSHKGVRVIRDRLAEHGPQTRGEIANELIRQGVPAQGQAAYHLLYMAGLQRIICLGPDRDSEQTFVLLEDRIAPDTMVTEEAAQAELARRYFSAYGPATPEDLASWSGLPVGQARAACEGVRSQLFEVELEGDPMWMLKSRRALLEEPPPRAPLVRLLPRFDTYLLGYKSRELVVDSQHARRIHPGGGMLRPALLVDGRALGTWSIKSYRHRIDILIEPFRKLDDDILAELESEVADLGRFLALSAGLVLEKPS